MKHTPLAVEKIQEFTKPRMKPGEYEFLVSNAIEKISKSGNEMIEISLKIQDIIVKDYLVNMQSMEWKLYTFLKSIDMAHLYEKDEIDPLLLTGARGKVKLKQDDKYLKVDSYIEKSEEITEKDDDFSNIDFDDEMPF